MALRLWLHPFVWVEDRLSQSTRSPRSLLGLGLCFLCSLWLFPLCSAYCLLKSAYCLPASVLFVATPLPAFVCVRLCSCLWLLCLGLPVRGARFPQRILVRGILRALRVSAASIRLFRAFCALCGSPPLLCLLPTAFCLLPTAYCPVPTAYYFSAASPPGGRQSGT